MREYDPPVYSGTFGVVKNSPHGYVVLNKICNSHIAYFRNLDLAKQVADLGFLRPEDLK